MTDPSSILPEKYDREIYDLSNLHIHPDIQVRNCADEDALDRYTMSYKEFCMGLPPIKVCVSNETGEFYVVDGHHRLEAAKRAGLTCIEGYDLGEMSLSEMISESIKSNCEQGLALSKADRKRAVEMLAKYTPDITARSAARLVGLSKSLVAQILKEYRARSVVRCDECKATVLRLFAEDPTNGWIHVPETKRERWFCSEDHRRAFYAKQAEKEAERQAKREQDEAHRNSQIDEDEKLDSFYDSIPDSDKDFDPKPGNDSHFHLCPCYKCGSKAFYSHPLGHNHLVLCSNRNCNEIIFSPYKDKVLSTWNTIYKVNTERDHHEPCPVCGSKPFMHVNPDHSHPYRVTCENLECFFGTDEPFETNPIEAWNVWDDAVILQSRKDFAFYDRGASAYNEDLEKPAVTFSSNEDDEDDDDNDVDISDDLKPCLTEPAHEKSFASQLVKLLRVGYKWTVGDYQIHLKLCQKDGLDVLYIYHTDGKLPVAGYYALPDLINIEVPPLSDVPQ